MLIQEPKVEFVKLELKNITTSSGGAAVAYCIKVGGSSMRKDSFCAEMLMPSMPQETICFATQTDIT